MNNTESKRYLALDVLRGLSIMGMILVNNPAHFSSIIPILRHVSWDGLSPADMVAPIFMFVMGVSMYVSLSKYHFQCSTKLITKISLRCALLFAIGVLINYVGSSLYDGWIASLEYLRILGTLQRLALVYLATALCCMIYPPKAYLSIAICTLIGYAGLMHVCDSEVSSPQNIHGIIDRAILGVNHLHMKGQWSYGADPEGFLGVISGVAHALLGMWTGKTLFHSELNVYERLNKIFIAGSLLLLLGYLFSFNFPINKVLWSSTFVATTCGTGMLLLGVLYYNVDIKGYRSWTSPFRAFGVNPLFLYVAAAFLSIWMRWSGLTEELYTTVFATHFGAVLGNLLYSLLFLLIFTIPALILYKLKIYIKL